MMASKKGRAKRAARQAKEKKFHLRQSGDLPPWKGVKVLRRTKRMR